MISEFDVIVYQPVFQWLQNLPIPILLGIWIPKKQKTKKHALGKTAMFMLRILPIFQLKNGLKNWSYRAPHVFW